jgi:HAD superfamily hydrolase (TIGR01509 family)
MTDCEQNLTPPEKVPFRPGAVIFDMDGLMLDTERPVIELWQQAARSQGREISVETVLLTIGVNEKTTRGIIRETCGEDFPYDLIRKELSRLFHELMEMRGIPLKPGLPVMLDKLEKLNVPFAVATSTRRESALWRLERAGIRERFTILACGDEISRGKPAPDIFLLAAKRLGRPPASCIGFEDSPAGLQALAAAGIPSVFIKDLLEPPAEILTTVWRRCADLAEAAELFALP